MSKRSYKNLTPLSSNRSISVPRRRRGQSTPKSPQREYQPPNTERQELENSPNLVNYEDIENAYQEDTAALMLAAAENHFNEYSDQSSSMPTDLIMAIRDEDQRH